MSARYRFYLDNQLLTDEPIGWEDIVTEIDRDLTIHGLLVKTNITLEFRGDGYDYIKCIFDANSFCKEIAIIIEERCSEDDDWTVVIEGLLSCVDMQFDMTKCTVKCPVEDNSYFARIKNNQSIEAFPHVGKSKSGVDIAPATLQLCTMFIPSTGLPEGVNRYAYRVFELYSFLVQFMSDGEVDFKSTLFDVGGEFEGLFVTNGLHLATAVAADYQNVDIGSMSFKKLNEEVFKICNIGFTIEIISGRPTLVAEKEDYFYGSTITDTLDNVLNVTKKVKTDLLYAKLNIGSTTTDNSVLLSFPEDIQFFGFKDEEYHLTGQCNIETTFDLLGEWIRSSNIIEDLVVNASSAYDEDFIFVMASNVSAGVYAATRFDILNIGGLPVYYNGNLTNDKIALRFLGAIPNTIVAFLGVGVDANFRAELTADIGPSTPCSPANVEPVLFDDDFTPPNFDNSNVYGNGTAPGTPVITANSRFTAPQIGVFLLHTEIILDITDFAVMNWSVNYNAYNGIPWQCQEGLTFGGGGTGIFISGGGATGPIFFMSTNAGPFTGLITGLTSGAQATVTSAAGPFSMNNPQAIVYIKRFSAAGSVLDSQSQLQSLVSGVNTINVSWTTVANITDYFVVRIVYQGGGSLYTFNSTIKSGSYFECEANSSTDGIFQVYNPEDFKAIEYQFKYPISYSRFLNIKTNYRNILAFNLDGQTQIKPWIENLKYNHMTSVAELTLIGTQKKTNDNCIIS